ncbi:MAG: ABC transporter ATP-binding protein [Syntrophales bacterium]|nr:ABC transporter ATP-binding protein [Syntrophales bacterium]
MFRIRIRHVAGEPLIDIKHLSKSYNRKPVLDNVSLSVRRGSILGLLGPNGAGKTTLISILMGVIGKDNGEVTIGDLDLDRDLGRIQSICSYVPQTLAFYPRLSALENLEYFGSLWGLRCRKLKERMAFSIDVGSMQAFVDKRVETFSGGMKRRLNLAIGLLNEPEILYLDEPTVGVDTQSRNYILETIGQINRERKTTIVYTSHYMDEIEHVSDEIAVIDEGRIILHDAKDAILIHADAILIRAGEIGNAAVTALENHGGIQVEEGSVLIKRDERFENNMAAVFTVFHNHGISVTDIVFGRRTLEELFLKLTKVRLRDEE